MDLFQRISGIIFSLVMIALIGISACTTDPVIPAGGIPVIPPNQDPGDANLCPPGIISFEHQILPIMISSCAYSGCHDQVTRAEGIVLVDYETVRREVKPGDPGDSKLYEYLLESGDDIMPPPPAYPLQPDQIALIREWILQGAKNTTCGTACDPAAVSFSADIFPLLRDYCVGCHSPSRMDGGVDLSSYTKVLPYAQDGSLVGTIEADIYYPVMPPTGSRLSACRVEQIKAWIAAGAQDN
ncbi:MAG: hypothetical protein D6772_14020 [Bacteroidetes bacterium]|nr:MAG: hypothetical protein D6772_14020 [Bacteroidota bacterium]